MKEYKSSIALFMLKIAVGIILLCPTLGLSSLYLLDVVWKYYSKTLFVNDNALLVRTGIINIQTNEIRYNKINGIYIKKNWLGRLLGYGTLVISVGNDTTGILFMNVDQPELLKATIEAKLS